MTQKLIKPILVILLLTFVIGCERDDICADAIETTPLLVIDFFHKDSINDVPRNMTVRVSTLIDGQRTLVSTVNDRASTNSISLPLRALDTSTTFSIIRASRDNADGLEIGNTDIIRFDYQTKDIFVSRACGFKTNYTLEDLTITEPQEERWVDRYEIITPNVASDEETTHVKIYH